MVEILILLSTLIQFTQRIVGDECHFFYSRCSVSAKKQEEVKIGADIQSKLLYDPHITEVKHSRFKFTMGLPGLPNPKLCRVVWWRDSRRHR